MSKEQQKRRYERNKERCCANARAWQKKAKKEYGSVAEWVNNQYSGTPCQDCKNVYLWCAMDFDHRPEEGKSFAISDHGHRPATAFQKKRVSKEILKCDVVCSNCHRVRTFITRKQHAKPQE